MEIIDFPNRWQKEWYEELEQILRTNIESGEWELPEEAAAEVTTFARALFERFEQGAEDRKLWTFSLNVGPISVTGQDAAEVSKRLQQELEEKLKGVWGKHVADVQAVWHDVLVEAFRRFTRAKYPPKE